MAVFREWPVIKPDKNAEVRYYSGVRRVVKSKGTIPSEVAAAATSLFAPVRFDFVTVRFFRA